MRERERGEREGGERRERCESGGKRQRDI